MSELKHPLETIDFETFQEISEAYGDLNEKITNALNTNQEVVEIEINGKKFEANVYDPAFTLGWLYGMANWYKSET